MSFDCHSNSYINLIQVRISMSTSSVGKHLQADGMCVHYGYSLRRPSDNSPIPRKYMKEELFLETAILASLGMPFPPQVAFFVIASLKACKKRVRIEHSELVPF